MSGARCGALRKQTFGRERARRISRQAEWAGRTPHARELRRAGTSAGSRECCDRVQAGLKKIRRLQKADGRRPWTVDAEISQTAPHELARGLDLDHHGEGHVIHVQDPSRLMIDDRSRTRITLSKVEGSVGQPGDEASGNVQCFICYNNLYPGSCRSPDFRFPGSITPPGSIFCVSKEGTGHNGDFEIDDPQNPGRKKKIPGVFGKAIHGVCLSTLRIRDPSE